MIAGKCNPDAKELKLKANHNPPRRAEAATGDAKELKLKANHNDCHVLHFGSCGCKRTKVESKSQPFCQDGKIYFDAKELKLKANHNLKTNWIIGKPDAKELKLKANHNACIVESDDELMQKN